MKKKFFTVAMAAVMAVSGIITAFAVDAKDTISGDYTITNFFGEKTDAVALKSGDTYTFKFNNKSTGTNNYENYVMVVTGAIGAAYTGADQEILIVRADAWGWGGGMSDFAAPDAANGNKLVFESNANFDTWEDEMTKGVDCEVTLTRTGNKLDYKAKIGNYTISTSATSGKALPETCYVFFTGENCRLTGFTTTKGYPDTDIPTTPDEPDTPSNPDIPSNPDDTEESIISGDLTVTTFFNEKTNAVALKSGDTYTFRFRNKSNGTNNYENYAMVVTGATGAAYTGADQEILIVRADAWGWGGGMSDFAAPDAASGNKLVFETDANFDAWKDEMAKGVDCEVTLTRTGNKLDYKAKIGNYTISTSATSGKALPETCYVFFTGEHCNLTGFSTTKNDSSTDIPKPTNPSENETTNKPSTPDNTDEPGISGDFTITTFFNERTNAVSLKSGDTYTFKFRNKSNGLNNWENYIMAVTGATGVDYTGADQEILIIRSDAWGWGGGMSDFAAPDGNGNALVFNSDADFDTWQEKMAAGVDCEVTVTRTGNTLDYTAKVGDYTISTSATSGKALPETCYVFFTGENCSLTGFSTIKNNGTSNEPSSSDKPQESTEPDNEATTAATTDSEVKEPTKVPVGDKELKAQVSNENVPEGARVDVSEVTDKTEIEKVEKAVKDKFTKIIQRYVVLDLSMMIGTDKVQPLNNGKVLVTLDIPSTLNAAKAAVYRMEADGSLTELASTVKDGVVSFETNHFSTYVIAEKAASVEEPTTTKTAEPTSAKDTTAKATTTAKTSAAQTGDTAPIALLITVAAAACAAVVISKKKAA